MTDSANLILPNLWVGDYKSASDLEFLKNKNITIIINCADELLQKDYHLPSRDDYPEKDKILRLSYPLVDPIDGDEAYIKSFRENLELILCEIDKQLKLGKNILIHCLAGLNRSATVVASYMITRQIKPNVQDTDDVYELVNFIRERRNGSFVSSCIIKDILIPLFNGEPFGKNIKTIQIILKIPIKKPTKRTCA